MAPGVALSVLSNLVQNALKYLGEAPDRRVMCASPGATGASVEVSDPGRCVPAVQEEHISQPYFSGAAPRLLRGWGSPGHRQATLVNDARGASG
jgi:signal transduction histidine kinase